MLSLNTLSFYDLIVKCTSCIDGVEILAIRKYLRVISSRATRIVTDLSRVIFSVILWNCVIHIYIENANVTDV